MDVLKTADWIIDLGPDGGDSGGYVVAAGPPETAVSRTKQRQVVKAAKDYLRRRGIRPVAYRFDIASVAWDPEAGYQVRLIKRNPKMFSLVNIDMDGVEQALREITLLIKGPGPDSLEKMVRLALEFESSSTQSFYRTAMTLSNPEVGRFLQNMGLDSANHLKSVIGTMKRANDYSQGEAKKPVWFTEFGVASRWTGISGEDIAKLYVECYAWCRRRDVLELGHWG